jgi:hypothetical protein
MTMIIHYLISKESIGWIREEPKGVKWEISNLTHSKKRRRYSRKRGGRKWLRKEQKNRLLF